MRFSNKDPNQRFVIPETFEANEYAKTTPCCKCPEDSDFGISPEINLVFFFLKTGTRQVNSNFKNVSIFTIVLGEQGRTSRISGVIYVNSRLL